jgi:DNA ligase D-like protein (predicted ligase)
MDVPNDPPWQYQAMDSPVVFRQLAETDQARLRADALPDRRPAMLATLTEDRFSDPRWIFERKFDGVRCLARRDRHGRVQLLSRNDRDMSGTYPEIADAIAAQADTELLVDGEVVAFHGTRTSFERLQGRLGLTDPVEARATGIPVYYYVFDILHLAGHDTRSLPLLARKKLLRSAIRFGGSLRLTPYRREVGEQAYRRACERGEEGIIAKRADSRYVSGRTRDWLKFKCVLDQELVIGGWTEPKGSRVGIGALLLGYYSDTARGSTFVFAGKVGTGFDERMLRSLAAQLRDLETERSPFGAGKVRERDVHWARPELVAEIGFSEWTRDGMLRHPRFLGLRTDKAAESVVRERPS